jgi:tRNA threonylcarbamoyladenosine biosynthesis protein TsaB
MLILGVDTSWKQGSIALLRETGGQPETLDKQPIAGGTFSAQLIPQLAQMLARHDLDRRDMDGFAAASGPGSFTGLRIGLTAIKALAEILHRPIATVSVLEAVAVAAAQDGRITAVMDASRGEIFLGSYEVADGRAAKIQEMLLSQDELLGHLKRREFGVLVTPEAVVAKLLAQHSMAAKLIERPGSELIARIGLAKIRHGQIVSVDELDANYIRRSDAEIFSLPKLR